MKNIIKFLESNKIEYDYIKYGGDGVYYTIPEITAIRITIPATEPTANEIIKKVEKSKKLINIGNGYSYGYYNIIIVYEEHYYYMLEKSKKDKEKIDLFWEIYHEQGKEKAEKYYHKTKTI